MGFETPSLNPDKNARAGTPEACAEQYYKEALAIAQRMSRRWQQLRENAKEFPLQGKLAEVDMMSKLPITGIQVYFESQINFINTATGKDAGEKSRMMYRLKEDLAQIEELLNTRV